MIIPEICSVLMLNPSTFLFLFTSSQGNMSISVTHGGDPIPKSPFHITVAPALDIGKVKVDGLDNSKSQLSNLYAHCPRTSEG